MSADPARGVDRGSSKVGLTCGILAKVKLPRGLRQTPCGAIADGVIAWRQGDAAVGLEHFSGIDFGTEQLYLGAMLLDAGRPEDALRALEKFDRQTIRWLSFCAWGAGEAAYLRAVALERLGRRAEALELASEQLRVWERADPGVPQSGGCASWPAG